MKTFIEKRPDILKGKPIIAGTRVPVSRILYLMGEDYTLENIHEMYPFISLDILRGAIQELQMRLDNNQYVSP